MPLSLDSFKKAELKTFLQFHREGEEPLRDDEITILNGVLSLNDRKASEIMTHIKDVLCLPSDHVLDHAALDHILLSGFSRIPVYEPGQKENFVGMLLVKRVSCRQWRYRKVEADLYGGCSSFRIIPRNVKRFQSFRFCRYPKPGRISTVSSTAPPHKFRPLKYPLYDCSGFQVGHTKSIRIARVLSLLPSGPRLFPDRSSASFTDQRAPGNWKGSAWYR